MTSTRSLNVQTYIDCRVMADLVREFKSQGIPHRSSYSHMLFRILDGAHGQWDCTHFTSTDEALDYLATEGFSVRQLKIPTRGVRLLRALNKEIAADEPLNLSRAGDLTSILEDIAADVEETIEAEAPLPHGSTAGSGVARTATGPL